MLYTTRPKEINTKLLSKFSIPLITHSKEELTSLKHFISVHNSQFLKSVFKLPCLIKFMIHTNCTASFKDDTFVNFSAHSKRSCSSCDNIICGFWQKDCAFMYIRSEDMCKNIIFDYLWQPFFFFFFFFFLLLKQFLMGANLPPGWIFIRIAQRCWINKKKHLAIIAKIATKHTWT